MGRHFERVADLPHSWSADGPPVAAAVEVGVSGDDPVDGRLLQLHVRYRVGAQAQ